MVKLTSSEIYNSVSDIRGENDKFELQTDLFDEFSFTKLKDGLKEILGISDVSPEHLEKKLKGIW